MLRYLFMPWLELHTNTYTFRVFTGVCKNITLRECAYILLSYICILLDVWCAAGQNTDEKKKLVQHLILTSFDPGEFLIRSLPIIVDNDTLLSSSFQIKVDEVVIDSANLAGFPIKPIMEEEYTWKDVSNDAKA